MKRALPCVFLLLCTPALAFQPTPAMDASQPIVASGSVQLAFSPEDDAGELIVAAIRAARKQILVQAYSFTHRRIAAALIEAHGRGVDVQLIADGEQIERMKRGQIPKIAAAGVPTYVDDIHSAHNKIMVIDAGTPQAVVITGSFNFTQAAQHYNAENLLLLRGNRQLTQAYLANWQRHRAHARTFVPRH